MPKSVAVFFNPEVNRSTIHETCVRNGDEREVYVIGLTDNELKDKGIDRYKKEYIDWARDKIGSSFMAEEYDYLVIFTCPTLEQTIAVLDLLRYERPQKGLLVYLCQNSDDCHTTYNLLTDCCKAHDITLRFKMIDDHGQVDLRCDAELFLTGGELIK